MRIVVNTRLLRKNKMDGIGWFTYNTLKYITQHNPDIEFHFLFDSGIEDEFIFSPNVIPHNLFPPAKHALLNIAWFEISVRLALQRLKPDLFISPDGILCLGWDGKQYGVMHDINYFHIPQDLKWTNNKYYNYFYPKYAQLATRIGTVSEYSKQDIVKHFAVPSGKIDVVYSGINSAFSPVSEEVKREVRNRYADGKDYFVFVSSLHPRKNIIRLIQAFDIFKQSTGSTHKLLIAGKEMYKAAEIYTSASNAICKEDILFLGRINDDELNRVMASAQCLTFVPYFEGFGLPLIEAMQCRVPVICSNVTSLPEIVEDAALIVNPYDVNEIAKAMQRIAENPQLRESLIEKGIRRKDFFSWAKTAQLLWRSIEHIL